MYTILAGENSVAGSFANSFAVSEFINFLLAGLDESSNANHVRALVPRFLTADRYLWSSRRIASMKTSPSIVKLCALTLSIVSCAVW
jgi:hypothetical protein